MNYMIEQQTILVVDDEPQIRLLLRRNLENADYQVVEAQNGRVAQKHLESTKIDVVFTDTMMPEMDGLELIQWIRQRRELSQLRIIGSSAVPCDSEGCRTVRQSFLDAGCDRFLIRPVAPQELLRYVRELLPTNQSTEKSPSLAR